MIAQLHGTLAARDGEELVVQTDGGVGYAVTVPLGVLYRLPAMGARVALFQGSPDAPAIAGFARGEVVQLPRGESNYLVVLTFHVEHNS